MAGPRATSTIVSQAFRFLEVTAPSSLEDNSAKAKSANEQYEPALRMCLEQEDWSFARRYRELPEYDLPAGETADADLPYIYLLPSQSVKLRSVSDTNVRWRLEKGFLRANVSGGLAVFYTDMIEDETRLPSVFQTSVACQLAILLSSQFVASRVKLDRLEGRMESLLGLAKNNDAQSASHAQFDGSTGYSDWACEAIR